MMMNVGICRLRGEQEINRSDLSSLMKKLEESVLPVCTRLTPDDRSGRHRNVRAVKLDAFSVTLHVQLLQIGWKSRQSLIIRYYGVRGIAEEIAIPDCDQSHEHRYVFMNFGLTE